MKKMNIGEGKTMKIKLLKHTMLCAAVMASLASCVKNRPELQAQNAFDYAQGVGSTTGLQKFSAAKLAEKTDVLRTGKKISNASITESENFAVEKGTKFFKDYGLVSYTTTSDLLPNDLPIAGRENFEYQIVYKFTPDRFRIYKVGNEEDFPHSETTFAERDLVPGKLAVPIYAYSITYFEKYKVRNADNRETNIIDKKVVKIEKPADFDRVEWYQIDRSRGEIFATPNKSEIFPIEYFQGEWFLYAIQSKARPDKVGETIVGGVMNPVTDATAFEPANRVRFELINNELVVYDLNIDEDIDKSKKENLVAAVRIPVEVVDYRVNPSGANAGGFSETVDDQKNWKDRRYIRIKWEAMNDNVLFQAAYGRPKLVDLRLANDFWSYTLRYDQMGVEFRWAFRKIIPEQLNAGFEPKRFFPDDLEFFGFFNAIRQNVSNFQNPRYDDISRESHVAKFNTNTKTKEITFHLSTQSPQNEALEGFVKEAIGYWDKAFKAAGVDVKINYNAERKDLGDHRYNLINIIDSEYPAGGLLGYGPSLNDPYSGQIISATSNIYIAPMRESLAYQIRNYILSQTGQVRTDRFKYTFLSDDSMMGTPGGPQVDTGVSTTQAKILSLPILSTDKKGKISWSDMGQALSQTSRGKDLAALRRPSLLNNEKVLKGLGLDMSSAGNAERVTQALMTSDRPLAQKMRAKTLYSCEMNQSFYAPRGSRGLVRAISTNPGCQKVRDLIAQVKNSEGSEITTDDDLSAVKECTHSLMYVQFMQTLVHEMGHNFGLRHNFRGTAETDPNKFWTYDPAKGEDNPVVKVYGKEIMDRIKFKDAAVSNSVMDYYSEDAGGTVLQALPGPYDIAALKFGYTGKVATKAAGAMTDVDTGNKSIRKALNLDAASAAEKQKLDIYSQCVDEKTTNVWGDGEGNVYVQYTVDPLCNRFDLGRTPTQIVRDMRNNYADSLAFGNYRYDRKSLADEYSIAFRRADRFIVPVLQIYNHWRIEAAKAINKQDPYLVNFEGDDDGVQYAMTLQQLAARDADFARTYSEYGAARVEAFKLLTEVIFLSNRYCVVTPTESGNTTKITAKGLGAKQSLIEFEQILGEIRDAKRSSELMSINNCYNPNVAKQLEAKGLKVVDEIGFSVNPLKYEISDRAVFRPYDEVGTSFEKLLTASFLAGRAPYISENQVQGFYPNMLDEPDLRYTYSKMLESRILEGTKVVSLSLQDTKDYKFEEEHGPYFKQGLKQNPVTAAWETLLTQTDTYLKQKASKRYLKEADVIKNLYGIFFNGLSTPGRANSRIYPYTSLVYNSASTMYGPNNDGVEIGNLIYRPAGAGSTFTRQLISEYQILSTLNMKYLDQLLSDDFIKKYVEEPLFKFIPVKNAADETKMTLGDVLNLYEQIANLEGTFASQSEQYRGVIGMTNDPQKREQLIALYQFTKLMSEQFYSQIFSDEKYLFGLAFAEQLKQKFDLDKQIAMMRDMLKAYREGKLGANFKSESLKFEVNEENIISYIKDLTKQVSLVNLELRSRVDLDMDEIYNSLGLERLSQEKVSLYAKAIRDVWVNRSQWISDPKEQEQVVEYKQLLLDLMESTNMAN